MISILNKGCYNPDPYSSKFIVMQQHVKRRFNTEAARSKI